MSVSISFENMVYEDALTILSYASPYPVKVCLQKQQKMPQHRRLSEVRTNLNHPLYRSQSVDAVNVVSRESIAAPAFNAKRSASEMRYDRRNSPKNARASKAGTENDIIEENNAVNRDDVFHKNAHVSKHNDFIQRRKSDKDKLAFDREVSIPAETDLPLASVDLNIEEKTDKDDTDAPNPPFTDAFKHLTEEDKLDVLRLSYDDPEQMVSAPFEVQKQVVEAEINHQAINADLRSAPMKPERKKKRSSTNSTPSHSDADVPDSNVSLPRFVKEETGDGEGGLPCPTIAPPPLPDDVFVAAIAPPTESAPPVPESSLPAPSHPPPPVPADEAEAEEEVIQSQQTKRGLSLNTEAIVFQAVTPAKHDISDVSIDRTVVGDASFADSSFTGDATLVESPTARPESPETGAVEEEQISATQLKKGEVLLNSVFGQAKTIDYASIDRKRSSSSESENGSNKENEINKMNSEKEESVQKSDDDFEKDFPQLDMNLNFDNFGTDSVIFKETFPSRHERESDGGMAYDISVTELESMEQKYRDEHRAKSQNQTGKGGIAFEVRDSLESGRPRTVNANSVHRTSSYELQSSSDLFITKEISTHRPTSFKGDSKQRPAEESGGMLDWSGKRLVRSGSFTEIPQDDSVNDWTDDQNLSEDDSVIEKQLAEDARSPALKPLTRAIQFQSGRTKEPLSDSDSQCRSLSSPSSSGSNSPDHLKTYDGTNGEDDGLGMSPEGSPIKISPTADIKAELKSSVAKYGDSDQAFTVTLNTAEDEEC